MAGAGYKLFNTGDVLTAAQVNTYLNEQTVMVFASSAARTSALSGVLAEGMMSYLQDTNSVEVYNGTSWVNVGNAGDITEVQAGVGISIASGTGPIPVITNSSTDLITTAGDILYGTAADTMARLGIGTAGQVLQVNSGATAPEWAAPAAGGKVLQVVSATTTTPTTIATTSQTDTTITATITPTLATSKILVILSGTLRFQRSSTFQAVGADLLRGATVIADFGNEAAGYIAATGATYVENHTTFSINYLDNPATTSATTYKLQANIFQTTNSGTSTWQDGNAPSTITLLEIGV
jgi:hypothetical protein